MIDPKDAGRVYLDTGALLAAVDERAGARGLGRADVAALLGLSTSTLNRAGRGQGINGDTFARLTVWLRADPRRFYRALAPRG